MEVKIIVPSGTDMSIVEKEYPDIYLDDDIEGDETYFIGSSSEDYDNDDDVAEFLSYDDAVACSGFVEGAIPDAYTLLEGSGPWAQSMLKVKDFDGYAFSASDLAERQRLSEIWHDAYDRGVAERQSINQNKER